MNIIQDPVIIQQALIDHQLQPMFLHETYPHMNLIELNEHDALVENGEKLQYLYVLISGKLKISTTLPNGRSLLLRFSHPISLVGDLELVNNDYTTVHVEAASESKAISIPHHILHENEMNYPPFLRFILEQVCYKLNTISISASVNVLTNVENRFASYLISMVDGEARMKFKRGELETTKISEIAELLGTSYRHLNRVIKKFIELNVIARTKEGITITDLDKLQSISNGRLYK